MDVIQHILSYNDDLRILKIKMNIQNIKYLFENIKELYAYLWCMKGYLDFPNDNVKSIYVNIIKILSDKKYNIKEVKSHILSLPSYHNYLYNIDFDDLFKYFIDTIINSYNNYYLDDEYYYDGYWYKDYGWLFNEGKNFYHYFPRIMKIKMNEQNMKFLISSNNEVYKYLRYMEQQSSFPLNVEEKIYLDMIKLLKNKDNIEKIISYILSVPSYNKHLNGTNYNYRFNIRNENWLKYFINIIINNYNNYYLNDKYYDNGYWYENAWIKDDNKNFYDGYILIMDMV